MSKGKRKVESSSSTTVNKILGIATTKGIVTTTEAERFLYEFANLLDDSDAVAKLLKNHRQMFHPFTSEKVVFAFRKELRKAWDTPDERTRNWYIFTLRRVHALLERS